MAFPEKITKRENKVLGWFLSIVGGLLLFGSLQIVKPTEPSPISIPMAVSSGLMFLLGIYCLFNKPTAVIVILGGISFAITGLVAIFEVHGLKYGLIIVFFLVSGIAIGKLIRFIVIKFKKNASEGEEQDPSSVQAPPDE